MVRAAGVCLALLLGLGLFLPIGCGGGKSTPVAELNVYNWEDYFAPNTLADFEKEFGIEVNLQTFSDEEEMKAAVQSDPGKYDVIFADESTIELMSDLRLLAPLDHAKIPNLTNIDPQFLNLPADPGNQFSVPYDWGTSGIAYNSRYVSGNIDSWGVLWDPRYEGHIGMLNNIYSVIGLTLKYLGYSLNSTDPAQLEEARLKLLEQKPLIAGYLDTVSIQRGLASGEIWVAMEYNGDSLLAAQVNPDIRFVVPKEGADFYIDSIGVPRDSPHKDNAELFINYLLRPDVQAGNNNYLNYASPNRNAIDAGLIDASDLGNPAIYPPRQGLELYQKPGAADPLYQRIWAELQR